MAQTNNSIDILTHLKLSIQISLNGLSFCVLDESSKTAIYLKHVTFEEKVTPIELLHRLKHVFENENELKYKFNSVTAIYVNEISALIPKPLFDEDYLADYLKFNSKILKSDFIAFDELMVNDCMNVYVPYINVNNFLYERFGAFEYKHFSTILIDHVLNIEKNTSSPKMYINVSDVHFEIVITHQGKLDFYNTFEYTTREDFIYYILFTIEQLKLNPETVEVLLLGDINEESDMYKIAYKYIRHLLFGTAHHNIKLFNVANKKHTNFILLNSF